MTEPVTGKSITLADFLTDKEIDRCIALYQKLTTSSTFASTVANDIITPNLARIDKALGQPNNARYLAYLVEYAMAQVEHVIAQRREV